MKKNKLIITFGIILTGVLILIGNKMRGDVIHEKQELEKYSEWLSENCECLTKKRYLCPEGYTLNNSFCFKNSENKYTLRLIGCSEYNCTERIIVWNNQTLKWEPQLNMNEN